MPKARMPVLGHLECWHTSRVFTTLKAATFSNPSTSSANQKLASAAFKIPSPSCIRYLTVELHNETTLPLPLTANVRHHHLTQSTCMGPDLFRPRSLRLSIPTWTPQAHRLGACTPCGRRRRHMYRHFSTTPIASSGHNRWSKIKHDKAKTDARTSKLRTQLSSDIIIASRRMYCPYPPLSPRRTHYTHYTDPPN